MLLLQLMSVLVSFAAFETAHRRLSPPKKRKKKHTHTHTFVWHRTAIADSFFYGMKTHPQYCNYLVVAVRVLLGSLLLLLACCCCCCCCGFSVFAFAVCFLLFAFFAFCFLFFCLPVCRLFVRLFVCLPAGLLCVCVCVCVCARAFLPAAF